jgi:hydrogenase expression/formation protein HypC
MTPQPECVGGSGCDGEVCITCSDVAVQVRVLELTGDDLAIVETTAGPEEVSVAFVDAGPGDIVLVHAKEAIALVERAR